VLKVRMSPLFIKGYLTWHDVCRRQQQADSVIALIRGEGFDADLFLNV